MKKERSVAIDALRGIAALTVIFYHARETNWTGATTTASPRADFRRGCFKGDGARERMMLCGIGLMDGDRWMS